MTFVPASKILKSTIKDPISNLNAALLQFGLLLVVDTDPDVVGNVLDCPPQDAQAE
jgi:hypothetical protein